MTREQILVLVIFGIVTAAPLLFGLIGMFGDEQ